MPGPREPRRTRSGRRFVLCHLEVVDGGEILEEGIQLGIGGFASASAAFFPAGRIAQQLIELAATGRGVSATLLAEQVVEIIETV